MKEIYCAHIDLRNFYASCEQVLNPELKGRPVVIYNENVRVENGRTIANQAIIAASGEAKKRGLGRGVPIEFAKARMEDEEVVCIKNDYYKYDHFARKLFRECYCRFNKSAREITKPHIDDISLVMEDKLENAFDLARRVERFYNDKSFEAAIGISCNKDYAHMAALKAKEFGFLYIGFGAVKKWFYPMKVSEFPNIGSVREKNLNKVGIFTIEDVANVKRIGLLRNLLGGHLGEKIYWSVLGKYLT